MASAVIERVVLRNFRSIRSCAVELGPLTFLVGPNGSGKSNFLDALRFVADSLTTSLDQALRERGGLGQVISTEGDPNPDVIDLAYPGSVGIRIDLRLDGRRATYAFELQGKHSAVVEFVQSDAERRIRKSFPAQSMSDGTLRALGVLTAVFQTSDADQAWAPPLIGIEEPEAALHPAAAGVLREAWYDASRRRQIVVTSHSPELLDDPSVEANVVRAVRSRSGETEIGPLDDAGRQALSEHLYTAGELLRIDQLTPAEQSSGVELFGEARP